MPADRDDDDDTPSDEPKSSRGPKKRFQERDDKEDDDDRPRKKRSRDDADDDDAPKKRRADDDEEVPKKRRSYDDDDDAPKKKRRASADDGPRVKTNDNIPIVMLLAFIGSALALLVICGGCGVWSFDWLVGGGEGFAGGGGTEFEVTSGSRQQGFRPFDPPTVSWAVSQKKELSGSGGQYYLVMKPATGQPVTKQLSPGGKGWSASGGGPELGLKGATGKLEMWVERRPNPVATGTKVSNVYVVP